MPFLSAEQFVDFFRELHSNDSQTIKPFPWQIKLAQQACAGVWPDYIAAPTGSGKTAAIDAAVFALAVQAALEPAQRTAGRRIFYIVNRRIIVDEAFERAQKIALALANPSADQPTVQRVAAALLSLGGGHCAPLECVQLRGGVYREQSWARSITQPLVICSTVDQVGSRLLFRGYGVSPSSRPIHAALVAHDSLLLLDEAHISRPFVQTLTHFKRYRALGAGKPHEPGEPALNTLKTPFAFVQMTATPPGNAATKQVLCLDDEDDRHPVLRARLAAAKPAKLMITGKTKGLNAASALTAKLCDEARRMLAMEPHPQSLAVLVNRVATAKEVYEQLSAQYGTDCVTLLIGRMRPFDRDAVTKGLSAALRTKPLDVKYSVQAANSQHNIEPPLRRIVVATQCLEVGADFDFDALITECASLDALRQRFGRLNRAGRPIPAQAAIVIRADQVFAADKLNEPKNQDPIYAAALASTWNWLASIASDNIVDFGINAMDSHIQNLRNNDESGFSALLSPTPNAPLLLPAHLDAWCQTSPEPTPQPEPALFLHGIQRTDADIQVCWRDDLGDTTSLWVEILALCPPTALECLAVPIGQFRQWLLGESTEDQSDILGTTPADTATAAASPGTDALIWRGPEKSIQVQTKDDLNKLRPGDTVVLASAMDRSFPIGHLPNIQDGCVPDQASQAWRIGKRRKLLRLSPTLLQNLSAFSKQLDDDTALASLLAFAKNPDNDILPRNLPHILHLAAQEAFFNSETPAILREALQKFAATPAKKLRIERYPGTVGIVIQTAMTDMAAPTDDSGDDATSEAAQPVALRTHLDDIVQCLKNTIRLLPLDKWIKSLILAASMHDYGKVDERFQAFLLGGNLNLAWLQIEPLAKSTKIPGPASAYENVRQRAMLPKGFRHEFLSVQFAQKAGIDDALSLHLIAAHHGYARPFAPVVIDDTPPNACIDWAEQHITLSESERAATQAHRLDSGIAERFWQLNRKLGWWNLAYLEAVLRLADWQVSASYTSLENQ